MLRGRRLVGALLGLFAAWSALAAESPPLRVVGGLATLNQYTRFEEPFWTRELPRLSNGRLRAEIVPFDRAGIRGQDMLRLMQLGVVPFGTALLSLSAAQDPLLGAVDLAGLNPDLRALRQHLGAFRPLLERTLRERHGVELLAVYIYPAQMMFCNRPITSLADVAGRKVRTASPSQADWIEALGGVPVSTPFAELVGQMRNGGMDCAITGSMSGNTIGLHEVTTHIHTTPVTWGMAIFGANSAAWQALSEADRALLRQQMPLLESQVWQAAENETGDGLACNVGAASCAGGRRGRMTEVRESAADAQRRREIFRQVVLQRWLQRCGSACASAWNQTLGPASGFTLGSR